MNSIQNSLDVAVFDDAEKASDAGYNYAVWPAGSVNPIQIDKVVVVRDGTQSGRPTVDLILKDEDGNKFVVMLTGRLLKSIPCGE